jgi:hypothetical protein
VDSMQQKNVVYRISCIQCEASYVGQTKRSLATRVKEYRKSVEAPMVSLSVNRMGKNHTGLPAHCLDTGFSHHFDFRNIVPGGPLGEDVEEGGYVYCIGGGEHMQYSEGQGCKPYLAPSTTVLLA